MAGVTRARSRPVCWTPTGPCQGEQGENQIISGLLPGNQGQNLALTTLIVPCSLDRGRVPRSQGAAPPPGRLRAICYSRPMCWWPTDPCQPPQHDTILYRGTSLIRKRAPLGPYMYSRTMPRDLGWSLGGGAVSYERGTPVSLNFRSTGLLGPVSRVRKNRRRRRHVTLPQWREGPIRPPVQGYLAHKKLIPPRTLQ